MSGASVIQFAGLCATPQWGPLGGNPPGRWRQQEVCRLTLILPTPAGTLPGRLLSQLSAWRAEGPRTEEPIQTCSNRRVNDAALFNGQHYSVVNLWLAVNLAT